MESSRHLGTGCLVLVGGGTGGVGVEVMVQIIIIASVWRTALDC